MRGRRRLAAARRVACSWLDWGTGRTNIEAVESWRGRQRGCATSLLDIFMMAGRFHGGLTDKGPAYMLASMYLYACEGGSQRDMQALWRRTLESVLAQGGSDDA